MGKLMVSVTSCILPSQNLKTCRGGHKPKHGIFYDNLPKLPAFCLIILTTLVGLSNKARNKGPISAQLRFLKLWV